MDANTGKKLFASFEEADKAAKFMRTRHNEPFQPVKVDGGWVVGGSHLRTKTPYKRVKSLADIRALFDDVDLADSISDDDVDAYAKQIVAETTPSEAKGEGEGWTLVSAGRRTGRELGMTNDKVYLALDVKRGDQTLQIQMGGAFSRHIPLVEAQAKSLLDRHIIWHTWNSSSDPTKWGGNKWFYMIEPVDD